MQEFLYQIHNVRYALGEMLCLVEKNPNVLKQLFIFLVCITYSG